MVKPKNKLTLLKNCISEAEDVTIEIAVLEGFVRDFEDKNLKEGEKIATGPQVVLASFRRCLKYFTPDEELKRAVVRFLHKKIRESKRQKTEIEKGMRELV